MTSSNQFPVSNGLSSGQTALEPCPDCRAMLPPSNGATHRYIGASAACWELFTALQSGGEPPLTPHPLNMLLADAYAAQHPGVPSPQAIQSVAVHLLTLYGVFVRGVSPSKALQIRLNAVSEKRRSKNGRFHWLTPPDFSNSLTIADIVRHPTPEARTELLVRYVNSVWELWSAEHLETVAEWYGRFVKTSQNMNPITPTFHVRDIPVYGDTILSPMAAYSDVPYRAICRRFGTAMQYTEFVPAEALLHQPNPLWQRLDKHPNGEQPLVFQIFGHDAQQILQAAQRIEAWEPDIIDINMGCSVPKISEKGAGVGMMRQPKLVADTFRLLTKHLSVPVTGKLRLGWDESNKNYLEIAKIMVDNGAALIALHGRTRNQKYRGLADWDAIARLKQSVSVPVLGNGDVKTAADIDRLKIHTGCDGVMIGRAALGNPWIFARRERGAVTFGEVTAVIRQHLQESLAHYGNPAGLITFRRHLKRYLSGLALKPFLRPMLATKDVAEFEDLLGGMETAVPHHLPIAQLMKIPHFPLPVKQSVKE